MGVYAGVPGIRVLPDPLRRHSILSPPGRVASRYSESPECLDHSDGLAHRLRRFGLS